MVQDFLKKKKKEKRAGNKEQRSEQTGKKE